MADAFGRNGDGGRQPAEPPKRPRLKFEMPSIRGISEYNGRQSEMAAVYVVGDDEILRASYESFSPEPVTPQISSVTQGLVGPHVIDVPQDTEIGGPYLTVAREGQSLGIGGRPEIPLHPDANSTLFVQGFPANCSRREASHIFRPFIGYKDTRLVIKEPRYSGGDPHVLCFVEFESPTHASRAMEALQGYTFDEIDPDSALLRIEFARNPGPRHRGEPHGYL